MSRVEMSLWLGILGGDISKDGFFPYFIEASIYDGPGAPGRSDLLALRRFIKEVRPIIRSLGVLLVGSFLDASIVARRLREGKADAAAPSA